MSILLKEDGDHLLKEDGSALKIDRAPIILMPSDNITASGAATTAQLTAPAGKTTSDFTAGRIQDDENPTDAVDITADFYTEIEWSIALTEEATLDATYKFRVTIAGITLNSYSTVPKLTYTAAAGANTSISVMMLLGMG